MLVGRDGTRMTARVEVWTQGRDRQKEQAIVLEAALRDPAFLAFMHPDGKYGMVLTEGRVRLI
jgi:hypothetical protein